MTTLAGRDLLTLGDWTSAEVALVLERAAVLKRAWKSGDATVPTPLARKSVAIVLRKPSLRTRVSFELAVDQLGGYPVLLGGKEDAFSRNETIEDTVRVLERYVDCIVMRTFEQSELDRVAAASRVPVINALTDEYHPCQVLADLLTIKEHKGRLEGLTMAWVGDGNNMLNSLMLGCAHTGMHLRAAVPEGFDPLPAAHDKAQRLAVATGSTIEVGTDAGWAVGGADVVVADTWASMGQEDEHGHRLSVFEPYRVTAGLMDTAAGDAVFMHCLPAHRGEEVTDEVIDGACSIVFDEAENRLHAQKAVLALVMGEQ
jgi:ornithine carbamoyltransferase